MNIEARINGKASNVRTKSDGPPDVAGDVLHLEIPVSFQRFTDSGQALIDAYVSDARSDSGERLFSTGRISFRPFSPRDANPEAIHTGPILFNAAQSTDTTVLVFGVTLKRDAGSVAELDNRIIDLDIVLQFGSLQQVATTCRVRPRLTSSELIVESFERKERPRPILRNLCLLAALGALLASWNTWLNTGVHGSSSLVNSSAVAFALGGILTFVGLSFARMKDWFISLHAFTDLVRFPELHLSTATTRVLSARYTGVALVATCTASLLLVGLLWSVPLPSLPESNPGVLRDTLQNETVIEPRVYYWQAKDQRFQRLCADHSDLPVLGILTPTIFNSKIEPNQFRLTFPAFLGVAFTKDGSDTPTSRDVSAEEMLNLELQESARTALHNIMCGEKATTTVGATIEGNSVNLTVRALAERAALHSAVTRYRTDELRRLDGSSVWRDRRAHVEALSAHLKETLNQANERIDPSDLVMLVVNLLGEGRQTASEGFDRKRTIERVILARALLTAFKDGGSDAFDDSHAASIVSAVEEPLRRMDFQATDKDLVRSLWELLLTFEYLFPHAAANRVHAAIAGTGRAGLLREGTEPLWLYVRAVTGVYTPSTPEQIGPQSRRQFFTDLATIRVLRKKRETTELERALAWIRLNEQLNDTEWSQIGKAFSELWAESYSSGG